MLCPRSSLVTSALFFVELTLLTKYYITKEIKSTQLIIGLSLISVFLANWQAAAWLFIIIFELPFIAEKLIYKIGILKTSTPKKEIRNQLGCSIISTIAIILAGLVNPYTYESEIYLWLCREHTKFTGAIADYIEECTQVQFLSRMWFIVIACFAILMIGIALKKVKPYEFFLALGTILVAYKQQRQCYMLLYGISSILVSLILLKYDTISEKLSHKKTKLAVYYIQVFLTAFFICAAFTLNISNVVEDSFKSIADYMDSDVEANDLNKEDLKILTECWPSAYMQYRGYKTFEDCRPETLSKYISGQTPNTNNDLNMDVMEEYVILGYLVTDTEYFDNFFETYDFDYAILYNTNFIHYIEYHTDDWVEIDEEELISDTGINTKYRLFKRIRN
jgi:hypothetical protein